MGEILVYELITHLKTNHIRYFYGYEKFQQATFSLEKFQCGFRWLRSSALHHGTKKKIDSSANHNDGCGLAFESNSNMAIRSNTHETSCSWSGTCIEACIKNNYCANNKQTTIWIHQMPRGEITLAQRTGVTRTRARALTNMFRNSANTKYDTDMLAMITMNFFESLRCIGAV